MLRNRPAWRSMPVLGVSAWVFLSGCGQGEQLSAPVPPALQIVTATDGPAPALVTNERRPFASMIGSPAAVRIGSRPSI